MAQENDGLVKRRAVRRRARHGPLPSCESRAAIDSALQPLVTYSFTRLPWPLSPTALRTALRRLIIVDSETIRPAHTEFSRWSLETTRSRLQITWTRRSNT